MSQQRVIFRPGNLHGHKFASRGNAVLRLPQQGSGLGNLLRSFIKWVVPIGKNIISGGKNLVKTAAKSELAKEAASALSKVAASAGINLAQKALKG